MKLVFTSNEGEKAYLEDEGTIYFRADGAVDVDGKGPSHGDPYYQPDTSLHLNGEPLNADVDRYIVVPPALLLCVPQIVLGAHVIVVNNSNGMSTDAVVGDIGPHRKLGELSRACAEALGMSGDPNRGGTDDPVIGYRIYPGRPAVVNGKQYNLQPYRI